MKTVTIGRTAYKINDARDIFAEHAKCTGKHRTVKSKGPERLLMVLLIALILGALLVILLDL